MVRVAGVVPGSIAAGLGFEIGSLVRSINGRPVRDSLDLQFYEADCELQLEVQSARGGEVVIYEIEKSADLALGIVPAPDMVRECANKCVFCFIDGNPSSVRPTLLVRDDDFRLSFSDGCYITLTNLGPRGMARLIEQKLSPLFVSVHATEGAVRERLLGVARGGDIMERLRELTSAGIQVHTQVVICPGWNDGPRLDRTLQDLLSLGSGVLSVSVVPVGLTRHNSGRGLRPLTSAEARRALGQINAARATALEALGRGWAYGSDEMFLLAGAAIPPADYYGEWELLENGVGGVRRFLDELSGERLEGLCLAGRRVAVVSGMRMAKILEVVLPRVAQTTGAKLELVAVENDFFGPLVTAAGLLPGHSILDRLRGKRVEVVLLPAQAINEDGLFIDDLPLERLEGEIEPVKVVTGNDLAAALGQL